MSPLYPPRTARQAAAIAAETERLVIEAGVRARRRRVAERIIDTIFFAAVFGAAVFAAYGLWDLAAAWLEARR